MAAGSSFLPLHGALQGAAQCDQKLGLRWWGAAGLVVSHVFLDLFGMMRSYDEHRTDMENGIDG